MACMTPTRPRRPARAFSPRSRTARRSSSSSRSWTPPPSRCAWTTTCRSTSSTSTTPPTSGASCAARTSGRSSARAGAWLPRRQRNHRRKEGAMTVDELVDDAKTRMDKSVESMRHELTGVRTGRASSALLDRIQVEYYGTRTPLNQLAQISVPDARLLVITPYDKSAIKDIEKAVMESDLGLNPANDGAVVRLPIPQLTEDRRKELVKVARHIAEEGRIAVRNVRRDVIHHLKELVDKGEVGADEEHRAEDRVQKLTDEHTKAIDDLLKHKEAEILEV